MQKEGSKWCDLTCNNSILAGQDKTMKALVIDDSTTTRRLIRDILAHLHIDVVEAEDGLAGIDTMQQEAADFVLVDWNMPRMDGLGFVQHLRADPTWSHVPIIMVTTEVDRPHIAMAMEAGADEYVMKPFDAKVLQEKLFLVGISTE